MFKYNKKGEPARETQVEYQTNVATVNEQSVVKISENASQCMFPRITSDAVQKEEATTDAREDDQSDISIQTERREEIESLDSIRTECESQEEDDKKEETREEEVTDGMNDASFGDGVVDGITPDEQRKVGGEFTLYKSVNGCKEGLGKTAVAGRSQHCINPGRHLMHLLSF